MDIVDSATGEKCKILVRRSAFRSPRLTESVEYDVTVIDPSTNQRFDELATIVGWPASLKWRNSHDVTLDQTIMD